MKKLLLALALVLAPTLAWGQCTGVFPAKTLCGNLGAVAAPPAAFASSGSIVGPVTSTIGDLATWANGTGTQLQDATGTTVNGTYTWSGAQNWSSTQVFSGNNTFQTGITNFTGTFEVGGQTFTWPAAGTTVGGLGTSQTWTGNNTFNTGTVNLAGTTQLNGGAIGTVLTGNSVLNNCSLAGSVAGSALTVALKDASGADPSASSLCTVGFRSATATTGTYSLVQTATPTAITAPSGASLGTGNGVPFRVWAVLFNNSGTAALGLIQTVTGAASPTAIASINEYSTPSPTAITAGSTSPGIFYAASSIGNKAFRILGYLDFSTGQATAGTWTTAPDKIQLFGPGIKKPGDVIQTVYTSTTSSGTVTNTAYTALSGGPSLSITPTVSISTIRSRWYGTILGINAVQTFMRQVRGASNAQVGVPVSVSSGSAVQDDYGVSQEALDAPGTTSSVTYSFQGKSASGTVTFPDANTGATMSLSEIMN